MTQDASTTTTLDSRPSTALEELSDFITANSSGELATGQQVGVAPIGAELERYPDLYLDLGRWTTEDSQVLYTLDVFFDCARSSGLIEPSADGGLRWVPGGLPEGAGIESGGEDCDEPINMFPEIFDHQPGPTAGVDIAFDFTATRVLLTIGEFSQEFETF